MNIKEFLKFNNFCPICGEPLSLYMRFINETTFKSECINDDGSFSFKNIRSYGSNPNFENVKCNLYADTKLNNSWISLSGDNTDDIINYFGNKTAYFFWICNPKAIKKTEYDDFEISMFNACYYRTSTILSLNITDNKILMRQEDNEDNIKVFNREECFSFKASNTDGDRIYILDLDHLNNKTKIWHYTVPQNEKTNSSYKPNLFEKEIPFLKRRPKFDIKNRNKLIERFDNWILMS